jgi:sensor histidine kinase regulating citrate/malate metabolism
MPPLNLMMNSVDAMEDVDGRRELTIQSKRGDDGQVLISVSDTGVGLPPNLRKRKLGTGERLPGAVTNGRIRSLLKHAAIAGLYLNFKQ